MQTIVSDRTVRGSRPVCSDGKNVKRNFLKRYPKRKILKIDKKALEIFFSILDPSNYVIIISVFLPLAVNIGPFREGNINQATLHKIRGRLYRYNWGKKSKKQAVDSAWKVLKDYNIRIKLR